MGELSKISDRSKIAIGYSEKGNTAFIYGNLIPE